MLKLTRKLAKYFDRSRLPFLYFLVGKDQARKVFKLSLKARKQRWRIDSRIKVTCFFVFSLVFTLLAISIFRYKQWSLTILGIVRINPTIFGAVTGLLSGLIIGVGLVANLIISYAHSIEARLFFLLQEKSKSTVIGLNKDERDERWKEYNLHIDLYKYYLELGLKANLFFYLITGTILGFYLTHPDIRYKKVSLLLPILMSLALGGIFIHSGILWIRVSRIIRGIRRELNIRKAPDINIMTALLVVFGFITLTVGVAMVLLVIVT